MFTPIEQSQQKWARVVGFAYLLAIPLAVFPEFYVSGQVSGNNAAETAHNILAHERLFRLGIASNLSVFALDVILITALYVVLKPVNRNLALLAAFWGLIETTTLVVATLSDFEVLRLLSGVDYLNSFEADRLQALAKLSIGGHSAAYNVGLAFAGLRSTLFCFLWFQSRYIPKVLSVWGMFASALMGSCALAFIIFPELKRIITIEFYGGPIFFFELTIGLWLLIRGLRIADITAGKAESAAL